MLTGVDADSTYCFLLEAVEHRDEDTWGYYLLEAESQGLNPDYTVADAGKGIRAGQKAAWGDKPCHGDVWHIFDQCDALCRNLAKKARRKDGIAQRGKTSVDWFFGFKLHLVVNEVGQLLNAQLTPGNVDDRRPIPDLLQGLFGKFFADRGGVSQKLANQLLEDFGIQFFAKPRRNMKNKLMRLHDKLLSRQRSIIETINDQLKNISQIEHSRHRSPINFCESQLK